jgi:pseudouridine-5'-phosphate glycosidase
MPQNPFKRPVFAATAVAEAARQRISGQHVTPFLLARVGQLTGGGALTANIALVKNNASVGGELAAKIAENERKKTKSRL